MTITKSADYEADQKTRRLFAALKEDAHQIDKQIGDLLAIANGMRRSLANALLGIAHVEALYVDQTEARRKSDTELFELQAHFEQLRAKVTAGATVVAAEGKKVDALTAATDRTATDRFLPAEPVGMIEGVEYVDMQYICDAMKTDRKTVRRYIEEGRLRQADCQENVEGRGTPRDVWVKALIDKSISGFQSLRQRKVAAA